MTHSDHGSSKGSRSDEAVHKAEEAGEPQALPAAARRTLDEIADALGVTVSLLSPDTAVEAPREREAAKLVEAATLLQAFIRISDSARRRRCIQFVQDEAEKEQDRA